MNAWMNEMNKEEQFDGKSRWLDCFIHYEANSVNLVIFYSLWGQFS